jgi:uncharacterized protein (TIGR02246 family)
MIKNMACEFEIKYLKFWKAKGSIEMTEDHQRIRALFESACAAWNRGDMDGYLADYWQSDNVRWVSEGTVRYGFEAIAAAVKARFDSPDNMGRLEVANLEIQLLGESDALVFGGWIQTTRTARRHGVFTVHVKKMDGEWLIVSDHSSTSG